MNCYKIHQEIEVKDGITKATALVVANSVVEAITILGLDDNVITTQHVECLGAVIRIAEEKSLIGEESSCPGDGK